MAREAHFSLGVEGKEPRRGLRERLIFPASPPFGKEGGSLPDTGRAPWPSEWLPKGWLRGVARVQTLRQGVTR